jgi:hypothetical protein
MFKFSEMAVIKRGNKKNFVSNELTQALAEKEAKEDMQKEHRTLRGVFNHLKKRK